VTIHDEAPGAAPDANTSPVPTTRPRRQRVGPFSLGQVTLAISLVAVVGVLLTLANAPLGHTGPGLPIPEPSAYLLRSALPGLNPGEAAPELSVARDDGTTFQLTDLHGRPIRLADMRGKVVWLNFWASWCPPCQSETPILRKMDLAYRDRGLMIIGVQVQQTVDDGQRYASTYDLAYRIGADVSADIFREYKVFALPTQFFIDGNGLVRSVVNGPLDEGGARALIEVLLPPLPTNFPGPPQPSPSPS
jgi:thiol-disulfide isomerase/thioredoxin